MQGKELFFLIVSDYSPLAPLFLGLWGGTMVGRMRKSNDASIMAARIQGRAREVRHIGKGDGAENTSTLQGQASSDPLSPARALYLLQTTPVPQIPLVCNEVTFSHVAFGGYFRSKP